MITRKTQKDKIVITFEMVKPTAKNTEYGEKCPLCENRRTASWGISGGNKKKVVKFLTGNVHTYLCKGCNTSIDYHLRRNTFTFNVDVIATKVILALIDRQEKDNKYLELYAPHLIGQFSNDSINMLRNRG